MLLTSVSRRRAARPRWRRAAVMLAALGLATGVLTGTQAATAHPAFAATSDACTQAKINLDRSRLIAVVACGVAGLEGAANPLANLGCLSAVANYLLALKQERAACGAPNAQSLSDNVSADPAEVQDALAAVGDTSPQPGDVLDTTFTSYDGQDSSGNYDYTLTISGWEDQTQWDGGGDPGSGCGALSAAVCLTL